MNKELRERCVKAYEDVLISICKAIEEGKPIGKVDAEMLERAATKEDPLEMARDMMARFATAKDGDFTGLFAKE